MLNRQPLPPHLNAAGVRGSVLLRPANRLMPATVHLDAVVDATTVRPLPGGFDGDEQPGRHDGWNTSFGGGRGESRREAPDIRAAAGAEPADQAQETDEAEPAEIDGASSCFPADESGLPGGPTAEEAAHAAGDE